MVLLVGPYQLPDTRQHFVGPLLAPNCPTPGVTLEALQCPRAGFGVRPKANWALYFQLCDLKQITEPLSLSFSIDSVGLRFLYLLGELQSKTQLKEKK